MATKKQARMSGVGVKTGVSRSDSTSIDASQDLETTKMEEFMHKHNQRTKERRRKRKAEIISSNQARIDKLHGNIKQCLQKHDERVRAIRRPKVERLIELANKKHALQNTIDKCQFELEQAFNSTAQQLQIALEGRVEELSA